MRANLWAEKSYPRLEEILASHHLELDRLEDAFGLLGVSACSWCKKFFRHTDPGSLLDGGQLVCYGCIPDWWNHRCTQLSTNDRENLESRMVYWLRANHGAELFKDPAKLPDASQQELNVVASCLECRGTGKSMGQDRCRYCAGRGTVWGRRFPEATLRFCGWRASEEIPRTP